MTRFYLIKVGGDGHGGPEEAAIIGPFLNASQQTSAAATARDHTLDESETLLWLDVTNGVPSVGAFDPMFWMEAKPR